MKSSFVIDENGITLTITLESRYEKAVGEMLQDFTVASTRIQRGDYGRTIEAVVFRLIKKDEA